MTPTKDELKEIQKELKKIAETGDATPGQIERLKALRYILVLDNGAITLTIAGKSILETRL